MIGISRVVWMLIPFLMYEHDLGSTFANASNSCENNMFKCNDGSCIPNSWTCDGDHDCSDRSDEDTCEEIQCHEGQFKCNDSSMCIAITLKCDGDFECEDHSDESSDCHYTCRPDTEFKCASGECIHMSWHCDRDADCADYSDEGDGCDYSCRGDQFMCVDNYMCISKNLICDGSKYCLDGSDEKDCGLNGQSLCDAGKFGHECTLECRCASGITCDSNGRCDKCDALWEGPTCQLELENIALNKVTEQGPITKRVKESKLAVDGNLTTSTWVQSLDENDTVYWFVDLEQDSSIYKIILHFNDPEPEDSSVEKRRPGWSLMSSNSTVTNKAAGIICYKDNSVVPADPMVTLSNCTSPARYISVYNSRTGRPSRSWSRLPNIELSEVQVLSSKGCSVGTYGDKCEQECGHCEGKSCDRIDGTCQTSCALGYYGDSCNMPCPSNCKDKKCEKLDGTCLGDCEAGFYGDYCNQPCSSHNCETSPGVNTCDKETGNCPSCKQKLYGDFCEKQCGKHCESGCNQHTGICDACKSNHYGNYCNLTCPQNCGVEPFSNTQKIVCQRTSGECLHCKFGYYGELCDESCPEYCARSVLTENKPKCYKAGGTCRKCQIGYFGDTCEKGCNRNCEKEGNTGNGSCDQQSGHCDIGCMQGWYNSTCDRTCNSSCKNHTCHRQTGVCLLGCEDGYGGLYCETNDSYMVKVLVGLSTAVTVVLLATVGGIAYFKYRRRRTDIGSNEPAVCFQANTASRYDDVESVSPVNAAQEDRTYVDLNQCSATEDDYSQLQQQTDIYEEVI